MQLPDSEALNTVWNEGDAALAGEIFAEDVVVHDIPLGATYEGLDAFTDWMSGTREAFPDLHVETLDTVVGETKLVTRWVVDGTHEGTLSTGVEPTGQRVEWEGATVYTLDDGVVTEAWWYYDLLGIFEQLGQVPPELTA